MKKYMFLFSALLIMASCSNGEDCSQKYSTPFAIEAGQDYCFTDGAILSILEITNSYCPCNVQCIWQGEAVATGTWKNADGTTENIMIHETLAASNPKWISFSSVKISQDCAPVIEEFRISVMEKSNIQAACDKEVIVDKNLYDKGAADFVEIIDASISEDCLTVNFSASGCDGNSWVAQLYDSGDIAESSPEQRYLRLSLDNNEACQAVFTKEISFDLTPLRIANNGVLVLNLKDNVTQLRYEY